MSTSIMIHGFNPDDELFNSSKTVIAKRELSDETYKVLTIRHGQFGQEDITFFSTTIINEVNNETN